MPRYFFHVHDGTSHPDALGAELNGIPAAQREAVRRAADLLSTEAYDFWNGDPWRMEVTDMAGLVLFTLAFFGTLSPAAVLFKAS